ncbi:MAG TPA: putative DNA binding domain-containing protein, partial [Candidatus Sphingobacterium stercoripullorum]|nr:putative DNA binding domain-containing protein [Candidatus Sphingobacterium stercoripullorum]
HDDYLKWVCGFVNAQGGVIYIGKDDNGNIVGLEDYKKLMDDIPNKIRNAMGITVEVNLHEEAEKHFIAIITHPYSVPISLRGRYYYRSGSTKQELTGASLNEFLLKKSGKTWDDVIEPRATFDDIDETAVAKFLVMAQEKGRLPEVDGLSTEQLFDKLRLTESGQLKRAALVLFGKDPGKFYPSINVRIGRFRDELDLVFQESEEDNIINLYQTVLNQINHKFIVKNITFEGMHRIETSEYPREAMREAILNALVHRNYMGAHTQIRVYDDKITFWNEGGLQSPLTIESLKRPHSSRPRNILIADVCFKGGLIDAWGRGTIKIIEACKQAGLPEPEIIERDGGLLVTLFKNSLTAEQLMKLGLNERQVDALLYFREKGEIITSEYAKRYNITDRTARRDLKEMIDSQLIYKSGDNKSAKYYFR